MMEIKGSIVALVSPMHQDGSLEWDAFEALVEWHIEAGTHAIVPVGTTGESATVDFEEHRQIIRHVVERVAGRVPVIAGTGANATHEAIELTRAAKEAGADACLLVTPYYNKPTQEGLYRHFSAVAESVEIPQILYNVPGRTACDMLPATVERLSSIDHVVGIKEATGNLARSREIQELCGDRLVVLSGDDGTAADLMLGGARGTISVTANVAPAQMAAMCEAAIAGDEKRTRELDAPLRALHAALFIESSPIPVKWALHRMGRIGPGIRLPLTELAPECHDAVLAALREAGVLE